MTQVFKNPKLPTALAIREAFPTPAALATASLTTLRQLRRGCCPSDADLVRLQQIAIGSIGINAADRQRGLVFEQNQLIKELKLIQEHLELLEAEICQAVERSREGQILISITLADLTAQRPLHRYTLRLTHFGGSPEPGA